MQSYKKLLGKYKVFSPKSNLFFLIPQKGTEKILLREMYFLKLGVRGDKFDLLVGSGGEGVELRW